MLNLLQVLAAIKFNDQLLPRCTEIYNILTDSMLSPKVNIVQLVRTQVCPQLGFSLVGSWRSLLAFWNVFTEDLSDVFHGQILSVNACLREVPF
jgi:hypothetical protein